ncbi:ATP-binding cassette domain-containing protein [Meiothermus rufus]|uniref:ATP-binding cassette domain-containing protein n=1 Tax=Meiothermus rufus TaxID=604332 RepID=UPI00041FA871|nr:ATP-binding cassette domain-containing protein [Meiothermus rufus]
MTTLILVGAVARGARWLLRGINLRLVGGELVVLLGPNGAGKTTLLRRLAGELPPSEGEVRWEGRLLSRLSPLAQARERAIFSQHQEMGVTFSAYEVAFLGRLPHLEGRPETPYDHQVTRQALHQTDSAHLGQRAYPSLSGGRRCGWPWPGCWPRRPACCCWMSSPTISTPRTSSRYSACS